MLVDLTDSMFVFNLKSENSGIPIFQKYDLEQNLMII